MRAKKFLLIPLLLALLCLFPACVGVRSPVSLVEPIYAHTRDPLARPLSVSVVNPLAISRLQAP